MEEEGEDPLKGEPPVYFGITGFNGRVYNYALPQWFADQLIVDIAEHLAWNPRPHIDFFPDYAGVTAYRFGHIGRGGPETTIIPHSFMASSVMHISPVQSAGVPDTAKVRAYEKKAAVENAKLVSFLYGGK